MPSQPAPFIIRCGDSAFRNTISATRTRNRICDRIGQRANVGQSRGTKYHCIRSCELLMIYYYLYYYCGVSCHSEPGWPEAAIGIASIRSALGHTWLHVIDNHCRSSEYLRLNSNSLSSSPSYTYSACSTLSLSNSFSFLIESLPVHGRFAFGRALCSWQGSQSLRDVYASWGIGYNARSSPTLFLAYYVHPGNR